MEAAAKLAAGYHSARSIYRLLELAGCPGGSNAFEIGKKLDFKRDYFKARKNDEACKNLRRQQRKAKKAKWADQKAREGTQYMAGGFGRDEGLEQNKKNSKLVA